MRRSRGRHRDQFAKIAPFYDVLMANVPYRSWANYVSELADHAGRPITPHSNVLDLATGTGSVALQFAQRGCAVTGVDLSPAMIAEARRKAAHRGLRIRFLQCDLAHYDLPGEFDHAICLYDSLNYILDLDGIKRAFANTRRALKPGGLLLFDVNTVRALEAELFTQKSRPDAAVRYEWRSRYDPGSGISTIRMVFTLPDGDRVRVVHRQRAYTDAELRSSLFHAGFRPVNAYEAYQHTPPTPHSDRVFYVAAAASQPSHHSG